MLEPSLSAGTIHAKKQMMAMRIDMMGNISAMIRKATMTFIREISNPHVQDCYTYKLNNVI